MVLRALHGPHVLARHPGGPLPPVEPRRASARPAQRHPGGVRPPRPRHEGAVRTSLPRPFAGDRFLDFGCGSGQVLRHLLPEAAEAEVWGCDIDAATIDWLQANLSPPLHVFVNGEAPPLPGDEQRSSTSCSHPASSPT